MNSRILVMMALFLSCSGELGSVMADEVAPATEEDKSNGKAVVLQRFDVPGTDYKAGMGIATFAPNLEKEGHKHSGPEVVYVLEGEVTVTVDAQRAKTYKAGDSWQMPADVFHSSKAGPKGARVLATWILKPEATISQGFDRGEVEKLVNSFMAFTGVSGVAISLIQKDHHEELYFGNAGPGENRPVTDQTLFEIGSITKVFTPHLMTVAQEEGKLSINDPVSKHIPALRGNPAFNQITLKDLATHTSALPAYYDSPRNLKSKEEVIQWLLKWKPSFSPKSQYLYSNVGIALIGFVLESVYQQSWDKLLTTKILTSRKMTSTYKTVPTEKAGRIAQGFDSQHKAADLLPDNWLFYPAGILKSSASDLGAYLTSWNEDFFKYLNESICFSNHSCQGLGIEAHPLSDLSTAFMINQVTVDKLPDPSIRKEEHLPPLNQIFIDKSGGSDGMSAYVAMIPSSRLGVVILCNQRSVPERISLGRKVLSILQQNRIRPTQ